MKMFTTRIYRRSLIAPLRPAEQDPKRAWIRYANRVRNYYHTRRVSDEQRIVALTEKVEDSECAARVWESKWLNHVQKASLARRHARDRKARRRRSK